MYSILSFSRILPSSRPCLHMSCVWQSGSEGPSRTCMFFTADSELTTLERLTGLLCRRRHQDGLPTKATLKSPICLQALVLSVSLSLSRAQSLSLSPPLVRSLSLFLAPFLSLSLSLSLSNVLSLSLSLFLERSPHALSLSLFHGFITITFQIITITFQII
jgi:hypothetical protein